MCGQRALRKLRKDLASQGHLKQSPSWSHHSLEPLTKAWASEKARMHSLENSKQFRAVVSNSASGASLLESKSGLSHLVSV